MRHEAPLTVLEKTWQGFFRWWVSGGWAASALTFVFAASRVVYAASGIRFDVGSLDSFNQFLDPHLLRQDLLRSLLYMHGQPPLFNLFLGLAMKLASGREATVLQFSLVGTSLGICLLLLGTMRRLGVPIVPAFLLCLAFALDPGLVLHENLFFYTLPVALLLLVSMWLLLRAVETGKARYLLGTYGALVVVIGIRSSYHILLFLPISLYLHIALPEKLRQKGLHAALLGILLGSTFYLKNFVLYGRFETSSWFGMNWWHVTGQALAPALRSELVARGEMEVSNLHSFLPLDRYPAVFWRGQAMACSGPPVLCEPAKSTGYPNLNHQAYFAISQAFLRDDLYAVRRYPLTVARRVLSGVVHYFWPASTFEHVQGNRQRIANWAEIWDGWVYGRLAIPGREGVPAWSRYVYPTIAGWFVSGLLWGIAGLIRGAVRGGGSLHGSASPVVGYATILVLYGALAGNLFDYGENMRYRFETDPLSMVLFALALTAASQELGARLGRLRHRMVPGGE